VRLSGPAALEVATPLIRGVALPSLESHRLTRVKLVDPRSGLAVDEALCAVMRAPRSYTGDDTVEISCHGSPALTRMLLERLIDQGARLAEPGEFTRRAFLNGRLDLAQAEAVALLIGARTERAVALAARGLTGELSERLRALRQGLLDATARLEVALDFPEEWQEAEPGENDREIKILRSDAASLLAAARAGHVAHAGLTVAIVGAPNAGKSSLFNALLGRDRAIVAPEAGTTRDVLEGVIAVAGVPVRLLDTAGLGTPRDRIDAEGMNRTRMAIEESDAVIAVVDGSARPSQNDQSFMEAPLPRPTIVVLSKSDLGQYPDVPRPDGCVPASVKMDGGLDSLLSRIEAEVVLRAGLNCDESALVASVRQIELLTALEAAISRAAEGLAREPMEIALVDLRCALESVSALLGIEVGDAVLDTLFARFCVGK
jgi:tRNA modification GTPase